MILQQQNRMQQSGCGSGQCANCTFGLICAKSPYCRIGNLAVQKAEQIDTELLSKTVSDSIQHVSAENQQLNQNMVVLNNNIQLIHEVVNKVTQTLIERMEQMNTDLKTEIDSLKEQVANFSSLESGNNGAVVIDANVDNSATNVTSGTNSAGVVPYSQTEETVLVEKKGLLGKSKWVEKKV